MNLLQELNQKNMKGKITDFRIGDTVRVHQKIVEGSKERIQIFEGVVVKSRAGKNINGTLTVRKISEGVGVERTFLVHSPRVTKIEVVRRGKVRRANLSYLRNLRGKRAKLKEKQFDSLVVNVEEESEQPNEEVAEKVESDSDSSDKPEKASEEQINSDQQAEEVSEDKAAESGDEQGDLDAEVTELKAKDEEDEEKLKDISAEKEAKIESQQSEKVEKEEENVENDETEVVEVEVEEGLEKAEDEDTKGQSEKSK